MDQNMLLQDFLMEIKRNRARFLSILLIVALGVAFFSGIRAAKPDMQYTAEELYDDSNLMDLRIVSTLGMTADDLAAVQEIEGVEEAVGIYTADVLYEGEESSYVLSVRSNDDSINQVTVTEGRLPERSSECVIDAQFASNNGVEVGDVITVSSGTSDDIEETFEVTEFVVVGLCESPLYIWRDRGTSSIGNGSVDGFMIVEPEAFSLEVYTEIDLTVSGAKDLNSFKKKYEKKVDAVVDSIEEIQEEHAQARYDEVKETAEQELEEAQAELDAAQQELDDAKERLEQAETEIEEAKLEIEEKLQEILSGQTTVEEQEAAIAQAESELEASKLQLDSTRATLTEQQAVWDASLEQLYAAYDELNASWASWAEQSNELSSQRTQLSESQTALDEVKTQLAEKYTQLEELQQLQSEASSQTSESTENATESTAETVDYSSEIESLQAEITELETQIAEQEAELSTWQSNIDQAQAELDQAETDLNALAVTLSEQDTTLGNTQVELIEAWAQLTLGETEYTQQEATLDAAKTTLEAAKEAIENGQTTIEESQEQIDEAESQLEDSRTEYEKSVTENEQKLKDATEELNEKKRELLKMEVPEWNILDRSYIQSVESYAQDTDRIGAIGNVFPLIFFLVAALVSLTSITRMVDEQRTQIGTLKALGYEKHQIAAKYICYALLASVIGGVLGLIIGQITLPRIIIYAYKTLYYNLPATKAPLDAWYSISSLVVAVLCTSAAAFGACYRKLMAVPAELMRPEAPKTGKKVFLEKWDFLWGHLNFSQKAAVRNMIRYKKRFFMTIFGIGTCMALLLVGFGLKNGVSDIGSIQFDELEKYSTEMVLENNDVEPLAELEDALTEDEDVESYTLIYKMSLDAGCGKTEKEATLVVASDAEDFRNYMVLRKRGNSNDYVIPDEGVIISEKLAKLLGVSVGDTIYLKDSDNLKVEVEVVAITENYYKHYVYMSAVQYEALYGGEPSYNEVLTINADDSEELEESVGERYLAYDAVSSLVFNSYAKETLVDVLSNIDIIVWVLIIAAALLAFIVLYNLNHINITERRRELASLKVLGFYEREVTMYVFRENVILTVIGIVVGLLLGPVMHWFVITTAELDLIMFGRTIHWTSYVYSVLLTIIFACLVNFIMHRSLKKIDMVESLKSVE